MRMTAEEIRKLYRKPQKARAVSRHEEDKLHIACVDWFDFNYPEISYLLFHPKNGGKSNVIEGGRFKRMGVRKGIADLILLVANQDFTALAIELKTEKGRQSTEQKEWQKLCEKNNIKYVVIRSLSEFINTIKNYLG